MLVLDAGTGIRRLAGQLPSSLPRVDILLTHLHLDHILGLGFFGPLYQPGAEVHIWGPAGLTRDLRSRLSRYLSPPLFPVHLRSLPCRLVLHEVPCGDFTIGGFRIASAYVCHPGPTVGYRVAGDGAVVTYLPDHEPALGARDFPMSPEWTSGFALAESCDLLIHDAQYTPAEYAKKSDWGHCTIEYAVWLAGQVGAARLALFHHDPMHDDDMIDRLEEAARACAASFDVDVFAAYEGLTVELDGR